MENKKGNTSLRIMDIAVSNYDIGVLISSNVNDIGRNTHYVIDTTKGKYFIKTLDITNENIRIHDEIVVCRILREKGMMEVPEYINSKNGQYLTQIDAQTFFNVQRFIDGDTWRKNQAPDWLLFAGVDFISDVHTHLERITLKQRGAIQRINSSTESLKKLESIEQLIMYMPDSNDKIFLMQDLSLRRIILQKQQRIELDRLTFVNGHSDYTITQMITCGQLLAGVIDFSEVSNIPAIWEIMRFYLNSAPEIKEKRFNKKRFSTFLHMYTDKVKLNEYDKMMLMDFNLYYFCQALSIYEKIFLKGFSKSNMDRVVSRNKIIRFLQAATLNLDI